MKENLCGFVQGFAPFAVCAAVVACNAAQQKTLVNDLPQDAGFVLCVVAQAVGGASVPAIALACSSDEATVGAELLTLVEEGQSDAGAQAVTVATMLKTTPAFGVAKADFRAQAKAGEWARGAR